MIHKEVHLGAELPRFVVNGHYLGGVEKEEFANDQRDPKGTRCHTTKVNQNPRCSVAVALGIRTVGRYTIQGLLS